METMSNAETYFQKYIKDMTDFVEGKVKREVKPTGDNYDTLANILAKELPYGSGVDNAHAFLTNAVISVLGVVGLQKQEVSVTPIISIQSTYKNSRKQ